MTGSTVTYRYTRYIPVYNGKLLLDSYTVCSLHFAVRTLVLHVYAMPYAPFPICLSTT